MRDLIRPFLWSEPPDMSLCFKTRMCPLWSEPHGVSGIHVPPESLSMGHTLLLRSGAQPHPGVFLPSSWPWCSRTY